MHATPHSRLRAPWLIVAFAALGVIARHTQPTESLTH